MNKFPFSLLFRHRHSARHFLIALSVAILISACQAGGNSGDDIDASFASAECTADTQKEWAYEAMQDFYLFYDQVPAIDPVSFDSADDLVRNVRFEERDSFSNVSSASTSSLLFDEGRSFGLGYGVLLDEEDNPRIVLVYTDSPFGQAGVERGDIIISVDGLDWDDPALSTDWSARVLGTSEEPATALWTFEKGDTGEELEVNITAAEYSINSVLAYDAYEIDGLPNKVGYLAFNVFLNTSIAELNEAFAEFQSENIGELVLDLRYNGGGRIIVARHLASLIGDDSLAGELIYEYRYNDKYTAANYALRFLENLGELNLSRVVILTTERTASSSEIVIAGLQPYLDVVTIGSTSSGKPFVSGAYDRCDERLNIMEAEGFNDNDVSVFGGVAATCYAADDRTKNFGMDDNGDFEGFLAAGMDYIENASCATAPVTIADETNRVLADQQRADVRKNSMDMVDGVAN